jgi:hypothetical protein
MKLSVTANFNGRNVVTYTQTNLAQYQHDNCLTALTFSSLYHILRKLHNNENISVCESYSLILLFMNITHLHQDTQLALYLCIVYVFNIANFIIKISQYVNRLLTSTLTFMEKSHFKIN